LNVLPKTFLTPHWLNGKTILNSHDYITLLQDPKQINPQKTEALGHIIKQSPYFQSARALYLKGLKQQESENYNNHLKTAAAYTTDRSILFDFITSDQFIQNEISQTIKHNSSYLNDVEVAIEDISVDKQMLIDDSIKQQIDETTGVLDPQLFEPKNPSDVKKMHFKLDESETIEKATKQTKTQEANPEDILNLGKPLEFGKSETHSFYEWLKLIRIKPIKRREDNTDAHDGTKNKDPELTQESKNNVLVDKFIAENPKISPTNSETQKGNLAKARMISQDALMTETLARIYVEQKKFKKAIQSYKILSLKYPEKSGFFADRIKAVELLREKNKEE